MSKTCAAYAAPVDHAGSERPLKTGRSDREQFRPRRYVACSTVHSTKATHAETELRLVQAWAELHGDELNADWELAANKKPLNPIDPLR